MKAVFQAKPTSAYDDVLEQRYHFPATYLRQVRAAIGDMALFYEPRRLSAEDASRGGRQSYFAIACVRSVEADEKQAGLFYAHMENYLDFDQPVPFRIGDHYLESALRKDDGTTNRGAAGRAVRNIPDHEYEAILSLGFVKQAPWPEDRLDQTIYPGFSEEVQMPFERPMIEQTVTRPFRDRAFVRQVQTAYDRRCAVTGLRLTNGGGRPEVQAAHIQPVASSGPDSIRNGVALSGTFHWMFDRGLFSVDDDYKIILSSNGIPEQVRALINRDGFLQVPKASHERPHPAFLRFHRENVFKG